MCANWRDIPQNLENISAASQRTAQQAAMQTEQLRGINFTSGVSAAANTMTALNTMQMAASQREQLQVQHEQLRIAREAAERTATHEYAMWRDSTSAGKAFADWHRRAFPFIDYMRLRNAIWKDAWKKAIAQANSQVPQDEKRRFHTYHRAHSQLNSMGNKVLLVLGILLSILAVILLCCFGGAMGLVGLEMAEMMRYEDAEMEGGILAGTMAFGTLVILSPFFFIAGICLWCYARPRRTVKKLKLQFREEQNARLAKWGFDPLTDVSNYVGFGWGRYRGTADYVNKIERLFTSGMETRPQESELPELIIPEALEPDESYFEPINNALRIFAQDAEKLAAA